MANDDSQKSIVNSLKSEWKLFWETITEGGDGEQAIEPGPALTREKLHSLIKEMSHSRKSLHQKLESLNKEIELNTAKLESLRMVNASDEDTIRRLNQLSDVGEDYSRQLSELDIKLKIARAKEQEL